MSTPGKLKKILVFQTAFLGDLILTIPLIKSIKKAFSDSEISVVVRGGLGEIIQNMDEVSRVIEYDKNARDRGIIKLLKLIFMLRKENFDIVFSPHRSFRTSLILLFSGISVRIGFKESSMSFVYTHTVPLIAGLHEIEKNLLLLKKIREDSYAPPFRIKIKADIHRRSREMLAGSGIGVDECLVSVAPGSHWATKRWLAEGYADVIRKLSADGYRIILLGSKEDAEVAQKIEMMTDGCAINLCGRTSILESASIIAQSKLLISNDSAAVHLASLTGTPVVVIYGPTLPSFGFTPYSVEHKIVEYNGIKCRPCSSHGPMVCPEGHFNCMRMITPDRVYSAVKELMTRNAEKI